jgi:hypothetical protein
MGSFANSLHVKSDSAERVVAEIEKILGPAGWQATEKFPARGFGTGAPGEIRGLRISAPSGGWVSVLDSDLASAEGLTRSLAEQLSTHAIFCFVNDSDSWSYLLVDPDGATSQFDSEVDEEWGDEDLDEDELGAKLGVLESLTRDGSMQQRMTDLTRQMMAEAPPDIQALYAKMQAGQVTAADMQKYQAWAMQQMPKLLSQLDPRWGALLGGARPAASPKARARKKSKAEQAADKERLDHLRPLLAAGVTDKQVLAVMERKDVFAENVLGEFLPLIGISRSYADLGYPYVAETSPAALAAQNVSFAHHLRFELSA